MSKKRANRNTKKTLKALKRKRQHYMAGSVSGIASTLADVAKDVGKVALAPFRTIGNLAGSAMAFGGSRMGIGGGSTGSNFSSPSGSFADVSSGVTGSNFNLNLSNQINADRLANASLGSITPSAATTMGVVGMAGRQGTRGYREQQGDPQGGQGSNPAGAPAPTPNTTAADRAAQKAREEEDQARIDRTSTNAVAISGNSFPTGNIRVLCSLV